MRVSAAPLNGVVGLIGILPEPGTPKFVAVAAVQRAIERDRSIAQRTVFDRSVHVIPKTAEAGRHSRCCIRGLRWKIGCMSRSGKSKRENQHSQNEFRHRNSFDDASYLNKYIETLS